MQNNQTDIEEHLVAIAFKFDDGDVLNAYFPTTYQEAQLVAIQRRCMSKSGYTTNTGRFVDVKEAVKIAAKADQLDCMTSREIYRLIEVGLWPHDLKEMYFIDK